MISVRTFTVLATLAALALGLMACVPPDPSVLSKLGQPCDIESDCVTPLHCCKDTCHECCGDYDCDTGERCNEDYECVPIEEPPTAPEPECTVNQDCEDLYAEGWECTGGQCVEAEPECTVNQDCEDLYAEGWECTGGQCAEAEIEPVLPHILGEFQQKHNAAVESGDVEELEELLFMEVTTTVYGPAQCRAVIENTPPIDEILDWTGPEPVTWHIDGLSIPIDNAWALTVVFADQDREGLMQLAQRADGTLGRLIDCGDPLPPTEPDCTKDADCGADKWCDVAQEPPVCAQFARVTFVISGAEPGEPLWAARSPEDGPQPRWDELGPPMCQNVNLMQDIHDKWNLIEGEANEHGVCEIHVSGNSWWTILGRSLGDERSPSGICALRASEFYEVTEQNKRLGARIDVPGGVQAVFECIPGCSEGR